MKLTRDDKIAVISALSYAIAANEKATFAADRYKRLRERFKDDLRGSA